MKRLIVLKNETSSSNITTSETVPTTSEYYDYSYSTEDNTDDTTVDYDTSEDDESETESTEIKTVKVKSNKKKTGLFKSKFTTCKKTPGDIKSIQASLTKDEIITSLEGYMSLKTIDEMKVLTTLPIMKSWICYINKHTNQYRIGGVLMKVHYPDYIVLANTRKKIVWSVQLKDNIIFIKDTRDIDKNNKIKDKLFKLYTEGKLILKN